jgi:hypothetical protein
MRCLNNPDTTLEYCQQFNDNPSTSPTPTATPTPTPSAGPAQHFTGRVRLMKGPFDLTLGNNQLTGCVGGSAGNYSDIGGTTRFEVTAGSTGLVLGSAALGSGQMTNGECIFNLDLGTFPQQTNYTTSFSDGKHGTLQWTLTEMQGKNFLFAINLGGSN